MGQIKDDADTAFRDYVTDGDAGSGAHEPPKADVRAVFALIDALVGEAGVRFTFDTSTTTADDPGAGDIRLNNATLASVTEVGLSDKSNASGNPDVSAWLATFDDGTSTIKGHLVVRKVGAPQNYAIFAVTAATDATTHWRFTVTHVASAGSFSAGDGLAVLFVPKGDKGDTGATGSGGGTQCIPVALSDETTDLTTGTAKVTFHWPYDNWTMSEVFIGLSTVSSSGAVTADVNKAGSTIFSTNPSIAATEDTSLAAGGTAAVLSTTSFSKGDKITVDIDAAGTGAKGLKVYFRGSQS